MPITMILEAEVTVTGPENILSIPLPGEQRPRLARFDPTQIEGKLATGAKIDVEVALVPTERIEVRRVAPLGTLGERDTAIPRHETLDLEAVAGPEELPRGVRYVDHDPHYVAPAGLAEYGETLERLSRRGKRVLAQLIGPPGCGKTSFAYDFAAHWRRPFAKIDMGTKVSPDELLGHREFADGRTEYIPALLAKAVATPRCVILLDEINRISPSNAGPLFPLLDHTGEVWLDYLQESVAVDPTIVVFGTANVGLNFTGTFTMDEALESRFQYPIEIDYPPIAEEAAILVRHSGIPDQTARSLVEFANETRALADPDRRDSIGRGVSTRALIAASDLISCGMRPGEAIERCIVTRYERQGGDASPRTRVRALLQGKFGK